MSDATYRIVGGLGARERVLMTGLTREEATERVAELQRDKLCAGQWFSFEEERQAAHWEGFVSQAGRLHGK